MNKLKLFLFLFGFLLLVSFVSSEQVCQFSFSNHAFWDQFTNLAGGFKAISNDNQSVRWYGSANSNEGYSVGETTFGFSWNYYSGPNAYQLAQYDGGSARYGKFVRSGNTFSGEMTWNGYNSKSCPSGYSEEDCKTKYGWFDSSYSVSVKCFDSKDCIDSDKDGYFAVSPNCSAGDDCNDKNASINPGAEEICGNDVDENCDGDLTCLPDCIDKDGDGYNSSMSDGSTYNETQCGPLDCDDNINDDPEDGRCANINIFNLNNYCGNNFFSDCAACASQYFNSDSSRDEYCCRGLLEYGTGSHADEKVCCKSQETFYVDGFGSPGCCDSTNILQSIDFESGRYKNLFMGKGTGEHADQKVCCDSQNKFYVGEYGLPNCCLSEYKNPFIDSGVGENQNSQVCCESQDKFFLGFHGAPKCCNVNITPGSTNIKFTTGNKNKEIVGGACCREQDTAYFNELAMASFLKDGTYYFSCCDSTKFHLIDLGSFVVSESARSFNILPNSGQYCCSKGLDYYYKGGTFTGDLGGPKYYSSSCIDTCETSEDCFPTCRGKYISKYSKKFYSEIVPKECGDKLNVDGGAVNTGQSRECVSKESIPLKTNLGTYCQEKVVDDVLMGVITCDKCGSTCKDIGTIQFYDCVEGEGCIPGGTKSCSDNQICSPFFDKKNSLSVAECIDANKLDGQVISLQLSSDLSKTSAYLGDNALYVRDGAGKEVEIGRINKDTRSILSGLDGLKEGISYLADYSDSLDPGEMIEGVELFQHGNTGKIVDDSGQSYSAEDLMNLYDNDPEFRADCDKLKGKIKGVFVSACRAGASCPSSDEGSLLGNTIAGIFDTTVILSRTDVTIVAYSPWRESLFEIGSSTFYLEQVVKLEFLPTPENKPTETIRTNSPTSPSTDRLKDGCHGDFVAIEPDGTFTDFKAGLSGSITVDQIETEVVIPHEKVEDNTVDKLKTIYYLASPRNMYPGFEGIAYQTTTLSGEIKDVNIKIEDPFNETGENKSIYALADEFMVCDSYIETEEIFNLTSDNLGISFEGLTLGFKKGSINDTASLRIRKLIINCSSYYEYLENENKPMSAEFFQKVQNYYDSGLITKTSYLEFKRKYDLQAVCFEDRDCYSIKPCPLGDLGCEVSCKNYRCVSEYNYGESICNGIDDNKDGFIDEYCDMDKDTFVNPDMTCDGGFVSENNKISVPFKKEDLVLNLKENSWNLVVVPINGTINASYFRDRFAKNNSQRCIVTENFLTWDTEKQDYVSTKEITNGKAYWIYSLNNCSLPLYSDFSAKTFEAELNSGWNFAPFVKDFQNVYSKTTDFYFYDSLQGQTKDTKKLSSLSGMGINWDPYKLYPCFPVDLDDFNSTIGGVK